MFWAKVGLNSKNLPVLIRTPISNFRLALVYFLAPNIGQVMQCDHIELWRSYPIPGKPNEYLSLKKKGCFLKSPAESV